MNLCPSLLSIATDDKKEFQCLDAVLNNKDEPLFLDFNWREAKF